MANTVGSPIRRGPPAVRRRRQNLGGAIPRHCLMPALVREARTAPGPEEPGRAEDLVERVAAIDVAKASGMVCMRLSAFPARSGALVVRGRMRMLAQGQGCPCLVPS